MKTNYILTKSCNQLLLLTLLSSTAIMVGCDKEKETPPTTSQQIDKIQADTKQAAKDMKDYAFAQKKEFVETMQLQLDALNKDLDDLNAKVAKASDSTKDEAKVKMDALRAEMTRLGKQLDDVKSANESTWDSVKEGFKKAYDSSKEGFQTARQWVSDKIKP